MTLAGLQSGLNYQESSHVNSLESKNNILKQVDFKEKDLSYRLSYLGSSRANRINATATLARQETSLDIHS
jgi:hypothetical protein